METRKPTFPIHRGTAIFAAACLVAPLATGAPRSGAKSADSETARRATAIEEAQELLRKGDEAYTAEKYADAVAAYEGARGLLPIAPVTAELRAATTERLAQASVESARFLSRKGDVTGAKAVMDKVLAENVAPNNPGALAFRAQLDDPIRTNPALTAGYAKDVDSVRRLLYTAEGAYNLGKFDEAKNTYKKVLRIDPTNSAARRGMEQLEVAKSGYQESAYDHHRAEALAEVSRQWETPIPLTLDELALGEPRGGVIEDASVTLKNKIDQIVIPKVDLDRVTLPEALEFLRIRARENDTADHTGVNIKANLGAPESPEFQKIKDLRFDLRVANLPLSQVFKYIADLTHTTVTTDDFAVTFSAGVPSTTELVLRTYRVPPDFITSINSGVSQAAAPDPFAAAPAGGLLPTRLSVQDALAKQGVQFPEGSSVNYIPTSGTLRVLNTEASQSYITQIIDAVSKTEPVMVSVSVTLIKVQQNDLEELGFDWLLDNAGFGGPSWVPGASKYNLGGGTVGNGRDLADVELPPGQFIRNPITSGNRSGDNALSGNSIDNLISFPRGRQSNNQPAPGIFGVRGQLGNTSVQALMRGLSQKKGVDLMARPTTITRSGQSSSISVVREMLYPTEYEPPKLPNSVGATNNNNNFNNNNNGGGGGGGGGRRGTSPVTPATPTAFKKKDIGIFMEVLPVADPTKQYITVTLSPSFTDFDGFVNFGSPINTTVTDSLGISSTIPVTENAILMPVFSKQAFTTSIDVADGATIVAGSLMQNAVQNVEDKTPILGSIPIIGRLFQTQARKTTSTAILFLVHVELMDPTGRLYRDR
jgi:general secretion pathway protein D